MNFGQALEAVKNGNNIARKGWNGKNQFVYLIEGREFQTGLHYGFGEYANEPTFVDALAIRTTKNEIQVGWLASQTDMLANDWYILGEEE
ncbi:DUF2829 domain-containing protein [Liquorilactobacillus hordei]|uniref:DUF2829 domain-containing protein n=1 Tax=Liquorilactobacillus hordei TaxID=468911 RepID=UPI0039E8F6CC